MSSLPLAVGQIVELNDGRNAVIRFLGPTGFAPGEWIGVELDESTGKNDGSVKGDRYFDCEANYGMFLRAAGVGKILEQPKRQARPASKVIGHGAIPGKSRPSSISAAIGKSATMDPKQRESALLSPRSPTKQLGASSFATPRTTNTPPVAHTRRQPSTSSAKPRGASIAGTAPLASRRTSSVAATPSATRTATRPTLASAQPRASARTTTTRGSLAAPPTPKLPSSRLNSATRTLSEDHDSLDNQHSSYPSPAGEDAEPDMQSTPADDTQDEEEDITIHALPQAPAQPATMRPPPARRVSSTTSKSPAALSREVEDLQAKMRVLERKRLEDREKLKKIGEVEQERDKYASVMQKLQSKLQNQSQELTELKKQLKDSESSLLDIEAIQAEHDAVVEMATLDREMAEETAEVLKTEVEALRGKNEELALELEILREENQEMGREMSPEERTGQGWLQMERSNERLREALLRLRDVTQEQEAELKDQIKALEEEVTDFTAVKSEYEEMKEKLLGTEADVDDLRQQLEAALGAEDMIEELTERNMTLQEQTEELRATIEDLESLRELNDELEVNHVEAEKQLQEEIDFRDSLINENLRRSAHQQQTIEDCEYTISRFRELVTTLQADLEDMRASQQITDKEAEDLSSRSRAMLDLNMKLQLSASKTQVKTIDLELRRLEAEEASEHLSIVQLFLPEAFHAERDSVLALLRFKRIGFKANLVHGFVKERLNSQAVKLSDGNVFAACSVMDRLTWISAMGERFVSSISGCSIEDFAKYEGALYELEPVERALNTYIEALKRDDLNEDKIDEELQRSMAVMSHLASIHIRKSTSSYADDVLMQTSLIQSHLETTASAFSLCKSFVQANVLDLDKEHEGEDESTEPSLIEKLEGFVSHARGAKVVAGKAHRALSDLQSRGLALGPSKLEVFVAAEQAALDLAHFTRTVGETLQTLFGEEGREEPFKVSEVNLALTRCSTTAFKLASPESTTLSTVANRIRALTNELNELGALPTDLDNTIEFERSPAPWVVRSAEVRATKLTSVDTEAEVARLTDIVHERSLLVRSKEQELEEQGVRIEMLEARMAEAQKRSAQLADLEASLGTFKEMEQNLRDELAEAQKDLKRLRHERDDLRHEVAEHKAAAQDAYAPTDAGFGGGASRLELDRAKAQEKNLKAAIRYLQREATIVALGKTTDLDWLKEPLFPTPTTQQRQLGLLEAEAKSAFSELLNVVVKSQPIKISTQTTKNRLAWRPVQETTAWTTQKRREEWETWRDWQNDLIRRARANVNGMSYGLPDELMQRKFCAEGHNEIPGGGFDHRRGSLNGLMYDSLNCLC